MQVNNIKCPGCGASVGVVEGAAVSYNCSYCDTVLLLKQPNAEMPEVQNHASDNFGHSMSRSDEGIGAPIAGRRKSNGLMIFIGCAVFLVIIIFAVRGLSNNAVRNIVEVLESGYSSDIPPEERNEHNSVNGSAYDENTLGNNHVPNHSPGDMPGSYSIDMEFDLYPFRITVNDIFIVDDAFTPPGVGNKHVGLSFVFENISEESQWIGHNQALVYVDGFLTGESHMASFAIRDSRGSTWMGGDLSAGRSARVHYAVEIPIGTMEIELELNCGEVLFERRQSEILTLRVPQVEGNQVRPGSGANDSGAGANVFGGYTVGLQYELYPFRIDVDEIFIVTRSFTPPSEGNKYVGITFIFENISAETQWISHTHVSVFIDGFLTSESHAAGFDIQDNLGTFSLNSELSVGRSARIHYALEVPVGTREIELELSCGSIFSDRRQVEVIPLNVPQD